MSHCDAMNSSVIVWDLETVPDLSGFAAASELVGKTDDEIREAIGNKQRMNNRGATRIAPANRADRNAIIIIFPA
jgi:hypothetical protein